MAEHPTLIRPGEGKVMAVATFGTTFKVLSEASQGAVAVVEHTLGPGRLGAPLHRHSREDEISHVLEGELTVQQGEHIDIAGPGAYIHKPRGVFHAFWNAGTKPVRFIEIIAPGGFERYFGELETLLPADGPPPDVVALAALAARYGLDFDFASVSDLMSRHSLRLD